MTTTPNDAAVNAESAAKLVSDEDVIRAGIAYCLAKRRNDYHVLGMRAALEGFAKALIERHATQPSLFSKEESDLIVKTHQVVHDAFATPQAQATHGASAAQPCETCDGTGQMDGWIVGGIGGARHTQKIDCEDCNAQASDATHGEGEAVAWMFMDAGYARICNLEPENRHHVKAFPVYRHPAPSPTAAPALEPATDHICEYDGIASCRICSGKYALGELGARLNCLADRFMFSSSEKVSMDLTDADMLRQAAAALQEKQ